ncbi:hypothetical protein JTB14_011882 [Gonioctena quinquepunctata]|nr:hypothetical protein JTB14_011882 [Gonioctena quinquepunctata]
MHRPIDFKNLDDVVIRNARIGSIDDKSFDRVERLKFQDCGFEDIPALFSRKLAEVHFGSCHLEQIPNLNGLLSLTFLNLTGNYIKNLQIESFAQLFSLEELHLSNNEIFRLPPTIFINNQELNSLYLDNNPIKHFYLNTSENLETLSLKNCQLEKFDEESARKLSTLDELILSHNKIKTISSKALSHMKELSVIDLSHNQLTTLNDDIFSENSQLRKISLDGNNFETLPNFFLKNGKGFSTYTFSCKGCGLKTLPASVFENMSGMISLTLSHNKFMNVDGIFEKIASLKLLDISYNNIAYLSPATFINNRNLETLNIAGNPLMVLNPEVFANNGVLREIDARNSSLTKLWSNTNKSIKSLRKILLGDNHLGIVTNEDFDILPSLEAIDLNNNPLIFDDKLCDVIHRLDMNAVSPIEYTKNLFNSFERTYGEDNDGFSTIDWKDFHNNKCPEVTTKVIPEQIIPTGVKNEEAGNDDDDYDYDYNYDDDEDEEDDDTEELDKFLSHEKDSFLLERENNSLARASYVLSVTLAFILSAVIVLTVAVTVTLCVLRKNNNFNMQKANLPRLKIPLWNTVPGQKKHSGSVYRPLSEDLSGPKTPKLSRYDFTSAPTVHSSNP